MGAYAAAVVAELVRQGLAPEAAEARLRRSDWWPVLAAAGAAVAGAYPPAQVAGELIAGARCALCGHPLHRAVGDLAVAVGGRPRRVRGLPHLAACSCGYADPVIDPQWGPLFGRYFKRHPEADEVDARAVFG